MERGSDIFSAGGFAGEAVEVSARALTQRIPILVVGRLSYAGFAGAAMVLALTNSDNAEALGTYTYQAGFGTSFAILLALGLDRVLARRVAAGEIPSRYPVSTARVRAGETALVVAIASITAVAFPQHAALGLSSGLFVIARLWYADIETFWIAAELGDRRLGLALFVNGFITGTAVLLGAPISAAVMTVGSAAGNPAGLAILPSSGRLRLAAGDTARSMIPEARGFGSAATVAVIYARIDLLVLAFVGTDLGTIAIYGIITRFYDALALVRGAIAQQESRGLARLSEHERPAALRGLAQRTGTVSSLMGFASVAVLASYAAVTGASGTASANLHLLAIGCAAAPLFFSHLPTTALVFADRRSHLLFLGSLITCGASVAIKVGLIAAVGVGGAVATLGIVEVVSCAVFASMYARDGRWRVVRSVSAVPIAGAAIGTGAIIVAGTGGIW